jgi:LysR family hca operon transcriptional activator
MELRHLRYFVAVAEEGSLTVAATQRLHTAQPSLSRQIRDLEVEVGVDLLTRSARGVELTAAGQAFLNHARLALIQVEAATDAARRAAKPVKTSFALGFLTGHELDWLPAAMQILHKELPNIEVVISSQQSPELARALVRGDIDVAVMRPEAEMPDLAYTLLRREPLIAVLSSDHPLAAAASIGVEDIVGETFIQVSKTAPVVRAVLTDYIRRSGLKIIAAHEADNLASAISLVASTHGIALLPAYARNLLPWSVISRPMHGDVPEIDLVLAYRTESISSMLAQFLSKADAMIALAEKKNP